MTSQPTSRPVGHTDLRSNLQPPNPSSVKSDTGESVWNPFPRDGQSPSRPSTAPVRSGSVHSGSAFLDLEYSPLFPERFRQLHHQVAVGLHLVVHPFEDLLFHGIFEIDQHVSAENQIELPQQVEGLQQVLVPEGDSLARPESFNCGPPDTD